MLPDRTKKYLLDGFEPEEMKVASKKKEVKKPSMKQPSTPKSKPFQRLDDELWDECTAGDWIEYFRRRASENGFRFIRGNHMKESSIMKSLMNDFKPIEIKIMMDFVWDAPHTYVEKQTMGLWILSKGWLNTIFNASDMWRQGKFQDPKTKQNPPKPQREWRPTETISVAPPAPTAEVLPPPSKKKSKIFI